MSGSIADPMDTGELTKQVMEKFKVDEKTAEQIVNFAVCMAIERMCKWTKNHRKLQKQKAEEIYKLTRKLKKESRTITLRIGETCIAIIPSIVDEIEKKILELCVNNE